jgi:hypothetical protein
LPEVRSINRDKRKFQIAGIVLLIAVILVLLASPAFVFSPTVTFMDTDLAKSSENRVPVQTKTDFGNPEVVASFPKQIGKWDGFDYDATEYVKSLGAKVILLRGYMPRTFTQPLFFTIVQAKTESSFHRPEVCFTSQGYAVQEEGDDFVAMTDASWLKGASTASIPFKKMVITKSSKADKLIERRVSLFCYVKGNQFYSDTITMLQTEALAPLQGSYGSSLGEQKEFLTRAVPLLFSPSQAETQWRPLAVILVGSGVGGLALLSLLFLSPIAMIVYPSLRCKDSNR